MVVAATAPFRAMGSWLKWLPHCRSTSSPPRRSPARRGRPRGRRGAGRARHRGRPPPRRVDAPHLPPGARAARPGPGTRPGPGVPPPRPGARRRGSRVVWLTDRVERVPRQASAVVDCRSPATGRPSPDHLDRSRGPRSPARPRPGLRRPGGRDRPIAGPGPRRLVGQRGHRHPPGRAPVHRARRRGRRRRPDRRPLAGRPGSLAAGPHRPHRIRPAGARPGGARAPRADRRHERGRQERAGHVTGGRAHRQQPPGPGQPAVHRLQGRGLQRPVPGRAAHRRLRDQPRRPARHAGADLAAGRAQPPDEPAPGAGQGPGRDDRAPPRRGPALARHRRRRVRHAGQGDPRLRGRNGRHRPAGSQPRHPPPPGHPAALRLGQRQHQGQHQPPHRPADARRRRVDGGDRLAGRGVDPHPAQGPGVRPAGGRRAGGLPVGLVRRPAPGRVGARTGRGRPVRAGGRRGGGRPARPRRSGPSTGRRDRADPRSDPARRAARRGRRGGRAAGPGSGPGPVARHPGSASSASTRSGSRRGRSPRRPRSGAAPTSPRRWPSA